MPYKFWSAKLRFYFGYSYVFLVLGIYSLHLIIKEPSYKVIERYFVTEKSIGFRCTIMRLKQTLVAALSDSVFS
jgi:hypothetical protein